MFGSGVRSGRGESGGFLKESVILCPANRQPGGIHEGKGHLGSPLSIRLPLRPLGLMHFVSKKFLGSDASGSLYGFKVPGMNGRTIKPLPYKTLTNLDFFSQSRLPSGSFDRFFNSRCLCHGRNTSSANIEITSPDSGGFGQVLIASLYED